MPAREICTASASVPVHRPLTPTEYSMPSASAVSTSISETLGERVEPRPITGPEPRGWEPTSFSSTPGRVGGVGDVDGDRDVGAKLERGGAGAEQADLLLCCRDRRQAAGGPAVRVDSAQRLERRVGAEAIVHRA